MKINLLLLSLLTLAARAQPIVYNESSQGDIDGFGAPPTFQFDFGENIISGSTFLSTSGGDSDAFGFLVPQGGILSLDSVIYEHNITNAFGNILFMYNMISLHLTGSDGTWSKTSGFSIMTSPGTNAAGLCIYSNDNSRPIVSSSVTHAFGDIVNSSLVIPFRPSAPLTSGLYWLSNGGATACNDTFGVNWNYTIKMTVTPTPTPEPSSHALLAAAAIGLASRRKRQ
jgi:hypothetical protein